MEALKEMILSGNLVAWGILIVLLIVLVKLLKSVGKGIIILAMIVAVGFVVMKFFPGIAQPFSDFIQGGWLSNRE